MLDSPSVHLVKTSEFKDRYLELHYDGDEGTSLQMNLICDHGEENYNFTVKEEGSFYKVDFRSKNGMQTNINEFPSMLQDES